jgi:hypothetical protein
VSAIFLKLHLGLGDAIICNGMVRVFAKDHEKVFVPAKFHNAPAVEWMFSDLPNVEVVSVIDDSDMLRQATMCESVGVGLWSKRGLQPQGWDAGMYYDACVPFKCRWSEFKLPSDIPNYGVEGSVFIHDDPERGYCIALAVPKDCIYMPSKRKPFEDHVRMMLDAREIHVIDSCFLCLADSIETNAKRHVLHAYATAHDPYKKFGWPTLRKNWEILR